jgi:RimJ/RimL family protein N-acetyltransferase
MSLVDSQDPRLIEWAKPHFERANVDTSFSVGSCKMKAVYNKDQLLAVVFFHNYVPGLRIEMSIASASPRWASKQVLTKCFEYCFNECNIERIYTQVMGSNTKALEMNKKLGFKEVAVLPQFCLDVHRRLQDTHIFSMTKNECKWLWENL